LEAQGLVINEVVSSNATGAVDDHGERPDWVEVYNPGMAAVNLAGYGLSDEPGNPFKWRFPLVVVGARGFRRVFASGLDQTNTSVLHTNFRLRVGGETLVLTRSDGKELDAVRVPRLREDVAWGRQPDGSTNWVYLSTPTPQASNRSLSGDSLLSEPTFSHAAGGQPERTGLRLAALDPEVRVHYTLDGSEPDERSAEAVGVIEIGERSGEPNGISMISNTATNNQHTDGWKPPLGLVRKATVVRARAMRDGALPSKTVTRTFWIGPRTNAALPMVSLATAPDGLFDYRTGIYVLGETFALWRSVHLTEVLTGHSPANYTQRGDAWERRGAMEYFNERGVLEFSRDVDLDIQGQSSRSFRQKSLGLKVRTEPIDRALFPGLKRHGDGVELALFRHVKLRNSGNDWAYTLFRDALCHRLIEGLPVDGQAYRPMQVFLNGEYWGVHNLREQHDATYFEAHYGIPAAGLVIVSADGSLVEGRVGANESFLGLKRYLQDHDLRDEAVYAEVGRRMDIDNFILYHAACIYFGNADWPHNNLRVWRDTRGRQSGGVAEPGDGRWRWLLFDCDLAFGHPWSGGVSDETLAAAISPTGRPGLGDAGWSTLMLRRLLMNPDFRRQFINTSADLMNSWFREGRVGGMVDAMKAVLAPAMEEHLRRWRTLGSTNEWNSQVRVLSLFGSQRPTILRQQYVTHLRLPGYARLTVEVGDPSSGRVKVNRLLIDSRLPGVGGGETAYPWVGWYFRDNPVRLEAVANLGYEFDRWEWDSPTVTTSVGGVLGRIDVALTEARRVRAIFKPTRPRLGLRIDRRELGREMKMELEAAPQIPFRIEFSDDLVGWRESHQGVTDGEGRSRWEERFISEGSKRIWRARILNGNR